MYRSWTSIPNKISFKIYFLFALIVWMAHFSFSHEAGLYEDDYFFISPPFGWNFNQLVEQILNNFINWPQGRPIGFSLPFLFSFIGYNLGGLQGVYVIAFLILFLNVCLMYKLAKLIINSESFALMAALAFSLFPADTTHPFLMHTTGLQPSLTFLLVASICYLSGRRGLSYFLIFGSLLTYETPFMVFWGIPLLSKKWDRKLTSDMIRHSLLLGLMLVAVFAIRRFTGDDRLQMGNDLIFVPLKILASLVIGPFVSISLLFFMPFTVLFQLKDIVTITILISLCAFGVTFLKLNSRLENIFEDKVPLFSPWPILKLDNKWHVPIKYLELFRVGLNSLILIVLGYTLSFTHFPPVVFHGRLTSVHLAASFGCSLLFACLGKFLLLFLDRHHLKYAGLASLVTYYSLAVGYGVIIQKDFVMSWCAQKSFWSKVLHLAPDLEDGTVIFFPYDQRSELNYIHVHSWADSIVLEQIYDFPATWKSPPRLFSLDSDWPKLIFMDGEKFLWHVPASTSSPHTEDLPLSNLILLHTSDQSLIRVDGSVFIHAQEFPLKPSLPASSAASLKPGPLYEFFMSNSAICNSNN